MNKIVSATEARKNFFQLLKIAGKPGSSVTITLEGEVPVVMMSADEFEGWIETLEIMSDPELVKAIDEGMKDTEFITLEELQKKEHAKRNVHSHSQEKGGKAISRPARARSTKGPRRHPRTA